MKRVPRGKILVPLEELLSYRYVREMEVMDNFRSMMRKGRDKWQNEYKIIALKELSIERYNERILVWYLKTYDADVDPNGVYRGGWNRPCEAVPPQRVLEFFPELLPP